MGKSKKVREARFQIPEAQRTQPVDVVISFDDTGSMSPCIAQVRRVVLDLVDTLFQDIPLLKIGIMVHGDYCDSGNPVSELPCTLR